MRKMRLEVEQLEVESFATAERLQAIGTVRGNLAIDDGDIIAEPVPIIVTPNCSADTMCDTCRYSCIDSCTPQPTCDSCHITMCRANCG
jgi:hypothetical protein